MSTNSQSPRANRESTNDPEAFAKGKVQTDQKPLTKQDDVNKDVDEKPEPYSPLYS